MADPYGGPLARYWSTATELGQLVARLTELLWPWGPEVASTLSGPRAAARTGDVRRRRGSAIMVRW